MSGQYLLKKIGNEGVRGQRGYGLLRFFEEIKNTKVLCIPVGFNLLECRHKKYAVG
jgi:hypothetical protein